ncbi:MAG: SRPBCC family protein [Proteobacteria bacterium]|nr:SRPBCC family protein [Pseudomonadota bacterium]
MKIVVQAESRAPPATLYAVCSDIANWPRFVRGVAAVELLDGLSIAPGARLRQSRTMHGREAAEVMTIAALDPPHRMVLTAQNHGANYAVATDIAASAGGSRIAVTFEVIPVTLLARIFSVITPLLASGLRRQLQADADDLAREADRRAGA